MTENSLKTDTFQRCDRDMISLSHHFQFMDFRQGALYNKVLSRKRKPVAPRLKRCDAMSCDDGR